MTNQKTRFLTLAIFTFIVFSLFFFIFRQPSDGYWDVYILAPAAIMTGKPVDFTDRNAVSLYKNDIKGALPDDLVNTDFGIATRDQRFHTPVILAPFLKIFGLAGLRILYASLHAIIFLSGFLIVERLFGAFYLALFSGFLLAANPYMLSIGGLNPNSFALAILGAMTCLLLDGENRRGLFAAGLLYGAAGGLREECVLLFPAIAFLLLSGKKRGKGWMLASFTAGGAIAILPALYFKDFAFGNPLLHPSQYGGFQGFRPVFIHSFLGREFEFNGLLNFPFHSGTVRTPHFAFPVFLLFPLVFIRCFGTILAAMKFFGIFALWKRERRLFAFFFLWLAPIFLLFAFQENWEEVKMTFMLLIFIPAVAFISAGIHSLFDRGFLSLRWKAVSAAAVAVVLTILVKLSGLHDFPADQRWYERFPHARENMKSPECLGGEDRNKWTFFHTAECPGEFLREKEKLTAALPFPMPYLPVRFTGLNEISGEFWKSDIKMLDTWRLIYTYEPNPDL